MGVDGQLGHRPHGRVAEVRREPLVGRRLALLCEVRRELLLQDVHPLLRGHMPGDGGEVALVVDDPDQDVVLEEHGRPQQPPGRLVLGVREVRGVDPLEPREDRGDLIQDITIELWRAWPRFDRAQAFSAWMQRIAINVAISFFRGESRRIRDALPIEDFGMDLAAADRVLDAEGDDLRALHQLIARLDDVSRALILLYLEGYSQE